MSLHAISAAPVNVVWGGLPSNIVAPYDPRSVSGSSNAAANAARGVRVVVSSTGILVDLAIYIGVSSGNISVGVYTSDEPRVRLFTTGTIACPTLNQWSIVGDPNIQVYAGQQLDFAYSADNATMTVGRIDLATSTNVKDLPAGFLPGVTGIPRLFWQGSTLHPLPTTIAESAIGNSETGSAAIIARVA